MWYFSEEERQLRDVCREFARREIAPYAQEHDHRETFNLDAFRKMGELGVLGITADPQYGGGSMGASAATLVMEEFGKACPALTLSYLAHSILCVNNIHDNASEEQKEKFLPHLISGKHIGCMGMSEPEHGSNALGIQTKAVKTKGGYLINGTKMWITNASCSDIAYIYARTGPEKNISTFILEKEKGHFSVGKPIHKMGMRGSPTGELIFDNVLVPEANRVGQEGDSCHHMMQNLNIERIAISGISLGVAQSCVDRCLKYASEREQFGKKIAHFQLIQKMVAEMAAETEMMRNFLYNICYRYDQGERDPLFASMVKLMIPKMATKIALDAIQVHGGNGYGREFPVERLMRDNKLNEIGAGTNEIMITIIAKSLLKDALASSE